MKGKWKPYSQMLGDTRMYIAGRQKEMAQPLHGGNIEHAGCYSENRDAVVVICDNLNSEEEKDLKARQR